MRQLFKEQLSLAGPMVKHRHARELATIDRIRRDNPGITEWVLQDLERGVRAGEGRAGMTAEQVLRAVVLKQVNTWSYDELSFHLADSPTYRSFYAIGGFDSGPSKATLQRNIKRITAETWQAINRILLGYAKAQRVENGRTVRIDATVTETTIHHPTDSSLLWDAVRVLTRLLKRAAEDCALCRFPSRARRARRRALDVENAKNNRKRRKAYRDLLRVSRETVGYAHSALLQLQTCSDEKPQRLAAALAHTIPLAERVIDQTERRVLYGEVLPTNEKLVSIFEEHTDIIVKDRRDTHYRAAATIDREHDAEGLAAGAPDGLVETAQPGQWQFNSHLNGDR